MKTIEFETNFNGKMECDVIIHVSFAPLQPVAEGRMKEVITIETKDGSHDPITCRLEDLRRCPLIELCGVETYASYGLTDNDFADWWMKKYPDANAGTMMAVYVYKKVNEKLEEEMAGAEGVLQLN